MPRYCSARSQMQRRHDLRNAAVLLGALATEPMHNLRGVDRPTFPIVDAELAAHGSIENVIRDWVAGFVKANAINPLRVRDAQVRTGHALRSDQTQVQLDSARQPRVGHQLQERFTVDGPTATHNPQLLRQPNLFGPMGKSAFDPLIADHILRVQLQPRSAANAIIGQRAHHSRQVTVIVRFVAAAIPQDPADLGAIAAFGRESVRVTPLLAVFVVCRGGVERGVRIAAHKSHFARPLSSHRRSRRTSKELFERLEHYRVPGGMNLP